jgi:hypothetical protein
VMKEPQIVNDWKSVALSLYVQLHGKRCVNCHDLVDLSGDVVMWELHGELMLTHRECTEKS